MVALAPSIVLEKACAREEHATATLDTVVCFARRQHVRYFVPEMVYLVRAGVYVMMGLMVLSANGQ